MKKDLYDALINAIASEEAARELAEAIESAITEDEKEMILGSYNDYLSKEKSAAKRRKAGIAKAKSRQAKDISLGSEKPEKAGRYKKNAPKISDERTHEKESKAKRNALAEETLTKASIKDYYESETEAKIERDNLKVELEKIMEKRTLLEKRIACVEIEIEELDKREEEIRDILDY